MTFCKILHILTAIAAAVFAWKSRAEIGAVFFVLLVIEGINAKMSAKVDRIPAKSKIKDYFDDVWKRKRTRFQNFLFFVPAFIWFMISWFLVPQLIVEQIKLYNYCPEIVLETGNVLIDLAAQIACLSQFLVLPFFLIAATSTVLFGSGIWFWSKIENLYIKK